MDARWLQASEHEVAAAIATMRRESRPSWVPTKRQVLVHVNFCLMLWYLFFVLMFYGIRVDSYQDGQVSTSDISSLAIAAAVLVVWLCGTFWLRRWAALPPSPRARMKEWRQTLTALANGFESKPSPNATFSSLIAAEGSRIREYPRFVAPGVEIGNLSYSAGPAGRAGEWHYIAIALPDPLPHLILDATSNGRISGKLPVAIDREQRLSLEGDFDRWFQAYSTPEYRMEALYVLTPDAMAALIDHASDFNVEIVDKQLVFFTPVAADFSTPDPWNTAEAILTHVAPRIMTKANRYLDERVPGQEVPRVLAKIAAERENPRQRWVRPKALIGPDGRRLSIRDRRTGPWSVLGAVGWFAALTVLYFVPTVFAFAGFMSIIDGR